MSYENNEISGKDEFDFAYVEPKEIPEERPPGKPFPPRIKDYDFFDDEKTWAEKPISNQIESTLMELNSKTLRNENDIYCIIGYNVNPDGPHIEQVLKKLDATIVSYYNEKHNKMVLASSTKALTQLMEKIPKYFQDWVKMIRPITTTDQMPKNIQDSWDDHKMVIINIMPNIDKNKRRNYVEQTREFLLQNDSKIYEENLMDEGLVFTESNLNTVKNLLQKSTFVYRVHAVPQAIAESIKSKQNLFATPLSLDQQISERDLPIITVMDSGLNLIPPLSGLIVSRESYLTSNPDDDHEVLGHGTPIASLATFGEELKDPKAKIISYKIWSPTQAMDSFQGLISGIKRFRGNSRIFLTSIGFPNASLYDSKIIDELVQRENICFVCSAGNISTSEISKEINLGNRYPTYLPNHSVFCPGDSLATITVGSVTRNITSRGKHPDSIAPENAVAPYSCCSTKNSSLFECKKPDVVEHGHNVNFKNSMATTSGLNGLSSYDKHGNRTMNLFGTSFSSPLFANKIAEIEAKYGRKIQNCETLKAISFISCITNGSSCSGYGIPISFTGCDSNHALFIAEGSIKLSDKTQKGTSTKFTNEIGIRVPNSSVGHITLCIVHSDDYKWEQIPSLNTYISVEARKTGSDSVVEPINPEELDKKTNVKFLSYSFEKKSMEAIWRFKIIPELTKRIPPSYRKQTSIRYGCAILLSRKKDEFSKDSLTQQIKEARKYDAI